MKNVIKLARGPLNKNVIKLARGSLNNIFQDSLNKTLSQQLTHDRSCIYKYDKGIITGSRFCFSQH